MQRSNLRLPLLLAALLLLAACSSANRQDKKSMADIDLSAIANDVFTLPDQRDMGYAVVKLEKEGHEAEILERAARTLTVNDLMAVLKQQAEQAEMVQSSPQGWVIEARNLSLHDASYATAVLVVRRERYTIKGETVSLAKLQRLILNGEESVTALGWAVYRDVLRRAVQQ